MSTNSTPHMLSQALWYAGAGINVFPVNGRKEPLTGKGGFHHATTDRAQIETWWKQWPEAGIATPDYDVIDGDLYKPECAATWNTIKHLIPDGTPHNKTPRGGVQYFFAPGTLKDGRIGPGIDSRYAGRNYVLLPPSNFDGHGRYEAVISIVKRKPKPAPEFPRVSAGKSEFKHLRDQMAAGEKIGSDRNKAAWFRAVEILRTLPANTTLEPVCSLVQSWVNANCTGDLNEVDVPKQVRGAARFVATEKNKQPHSDNEFGWTPLGDIVVKPIVFVEKPFLQAAAFHLLAGVKNSGKGTCLAHYAARVTRGELGAARNVIWIAIGEDSYAIDVRPRLEAAGADVSRVTVLEKGRLLLPEHAAELERVTTEVGDVGLIVVDPLGGSLASGKSTNFDADVRPALASLNQVADSTGAMVVGVRHFSIKHDKRSGGTLSAVLGSSDWVNIPRAVLALVHDDVDPQIRHLFVVAGNRVKADTPGLMFRIEGRLPPGHTEEVTVARILGESAKDPDELLAFKRTRKATKSDAAKQLILETLAAAEGHQLESDTLDAEIARKTGLTAKSVRNVRGEMKNEGLVKSVPDKDEEGEIRRWFVTLTGAAISNLAPASLPPLPTHDCKGSGLFIPHHLPRVSGAGESRALDEQLLIGDFVTPDEAAEVERENDPRACQTCGSNEIGKTSGRCRKCGTKAEATLALTPAQQVALDNLFDEDGKLR